MRQIVPRGFLSTVEATNLIGAHFVPGWTGLERDIAAASEDRAIRFPFIVTVETTSEDPQGHAARARWLQARERLVIELASSETGAEMLEDAGFKEVTIFDSNAPIGKGIHEMGTARMGKSPKTSVLNKHNQIHGVANVFVTDGACMTSSANQNPSLTYMALTARAANYAVSELKKQNL